MDEEIKDCNTCQHLHLDWKMAMPSNCWKCDFEKEEFKGYEEIDNG